MKNLLIKSKLLTMLITSIVGLIIFALLSYFTIEKLKVNGKMYKEIVQGKDLVADILPPPEYIIESYLVTLEMTQTQTDDELNKFIGDFQKAYYYSSFIASTYPLFKKWIGYQAASRPMIITLTSTRATSENFIRTG